MTCNDISISSARETNSVTRRQLLQGVAGLGLAMGAGLLLPGSAGASTATKGLLALPGGTPKRGGTFTAGVITGGSSETVYPGYAAQLPDYVRNYNLYSWLFYPNSGENLYPVAPGLALSAESNSAATEWTIHLRDGVTFHNGKPFTADDVVYNFKTLWSDSSANYSSLFLVGIVDFAGVKKLDDLTVYVPMTVGCDLPSILTWFNFGVCPEGATQKAMSTRPIGTGPYMFESFTPGSQSTFTKNPNYWENGKPYVDKLITDSSFTDSSSLLYSLLGGEINLLVNPALEDAKAQLASNKVQVLQSSSGTQAYMFGMRVDKGPFADNDIREAFKLLVNREQMNEGAFSGFGTVLHDLIGPYTQYYDWSLKREQDVDKAKYLFKKAGVLGKTFTWPTCNAFPGQEESATILAEQASAAGITVNVKVQSSAGYFTPADGAYTRYSSQNIDQPSPTLLVQYLSELTRNAPFPDTHWGHQKGGAADNALIYKAFAATKPSQAQALWNQVQEQQFNEGGYLVWAGLPYIDMAANNVRGLKASGGFDFNLFRFCDGWLA